MVSSDFSVGSIVYFLATKTEKVLPAQVLERIDRTSISGIKSTYIIGVKSSNGAIKKLEVDPEKINLFKTPEEMKDFMVSRATEAITTLVQQAVVASSIFEPVEVTEDVKVSAESSNLVGEADRDLMEMENWHIPAAERPIGKKSKKKTEKEEPFAEVDLGNGQTARMKI